VVNFVMEAVPLNILRIQRALHSLPPHLLADLRRVNGLQAQHEYGHGSAAVSRDVRSKAGGARRDQAARQRGNSQHSAAGK
jgi:hypothetical protein